MKLFFLSILFFFLYSNVSFAKSDPKSLDDQELCDVATYSGVNANKLWKIGSYKKYVDEAKKRGIDCGVKSLIKGEVINIPTSEVKLMLNHFKLYDGFFSNEIDEELIKAIAQLMAKKGFSYEDPNSSKAFTFVYESYENAFDRVEIRKHRCTSIEKNLLQVPDKRRAVYLCRLSKTEGQIETEYDDDLCRLATHISNNRLRWNVAAESVYVEEAKRRNLTCGVNSTENIDLSAAQIQTRLHHLGYNPGIIDGKWGNKSTKAFKKFLRDNLQEQLDPKSDIAESFLADAYNQFFEQPVESSVPCDYVTSYIKGKSNPCVVIGSFDGKTEFGTHIGGEPYGLWDQPWAYPMTRVNSQGDLEVVLWGFDLPVKPGTKYDGPGRTRMINFPLIMDKVWNKSTDIPYINKSRKMPFSVRRHELNDLNGDGLKEFFLLGSREDGRGRSRKDYSTMFDKNFIYDFERDEITTFGVPTFSHDYGIHDFNGDGYKDFLDLTLTGRGFYYCDGKSLKCNWQANEQFSNGSSFMAFDSSINGPILAAKCGVNDKSFWLCWFKPSLKSGQIKFNLIDKAQVQKDYDAKIKYQTFFGTVDRPKWRAWKIAGVPKSQKVRMGGMGYYLKLVDLDKDGDLDTVVNERQYVCEKEDKSRDYFTGKDCWKNTEHVDIVFLNNNGKFIKKEEKAYKEERGDLQIFDYVDINQDNIKDVHAIGHHFALCINDMSTSYINDGAGNLSYYRERDRHMGTFGCELSSHFFNFDNEPYRLFTFKAKFKEGVADIDQVYLGLEYLGKKIKSN